MDNASVEFVEKYTNARLPIDNSLPFYVLVETQSAVDQSERIEAFISDCLDKNVAADGTIAQNDTQVRAYPKMHAPWRPSTHASCAANVRLDA